MPNRFPIQVLFPHAHFHVSLKSWRITVYLIHVIKLLRLVHGRQLCVSCQGHVQRVHMVSLNVATV